MDVIEKEPVSISPPHWCMGTIHPRPSVLEIGYGKEAHFPQVAALHMDSSYLRLTGLSGMTWGTSIVLLPVVWEAGQAGPRQGAPIEITSHQEEDQTEHQEIQKENQKEIQEHREDRKTLFLQFTGGIAGLAVTGQLRFFPPTAHRIRVEVAVSVTGQTRLNSAHAHEAFKTVMLSSMHFSPDQWDTDRAFAGAETRDIPCPEEWVFAPSLPCHTFGLRGGQSQWQHKKQAPTVTISSSQIMPVAGRISPPGKGSAGGPNSDNVALWAAYEQVQTAWRYTITAQAEADSENRSTPL